MWDFRSLSLVSEIQPEINNNKITYRSKQRAEGKQARMEWVRVGTATQDTSKQVGHNDGTACQAKLVLFCLPTNPGSAPNHVH